MNTFRLQTAHAVHMLEEGPTSSGTGTRPSDCQATKPRPQKSLWNLIGSLGATLLDLCEIDRTSSLYGAGNKCLCAVM